MKRLTIALAAIGLTASCGAFAAFPANTDPTMVAVPQLPGGLVVGLTGIYVQPSASNGDTDWASLVTVTGTAPNTTTSTSIQQNDAGWSFGGGANIGYIFPGTGNDVNLSYLHLNTDGSDDNITAPGFIPVVDESQLVDPVNSTGTLGGYQSGNSTTDYTLDQVDLTFGQFVNVGCRLVLHPFAGARFASIERDLNSDYFAGFTITTPTLTLVDTTTETVDESSDFSGVGPIAGFDASYYLWNGFGVVGHFDGGLLVGDIDSSVDSTVNTAVTITTEAGTVSATSVVPDNTNADNTRRIVPVVDAALGLDYTWLFNNADNSDLTLEVGYKVTNYFNAIDRVYIDTGTVASSDLAISGVYATLTLHV